MALSSKANQARSGEASATDAILPTLLALSLTHAVAYLLIGIDRPVLEMHVFRQTQTALSTYWLLQGGPWLAYETPVLGAPWSVPFEFPTYQLIVAGVARLGTPLDITGRAVAFGFFVATLFPLRMLLRDLGYDRKTFLIVAVLYTSSPVYVFWGRTFMIESCALFFGVLWLALFIRHAFHGGSAVSAAVTLGAGCLSALTKATTFAGFGAVAGLVFLMLLVDTLRKGKARARWRFLVLTCCLLAIPLLAGLCWIVFTDWVKLAGPFTTLMTSVNLAKHNFGTFAQRTSTTFWNEIVLLRIGHDAFGYMLVVMPLTIAFGLFARLDYRVLIGVAAFLLPLVVFTNLYEVHNYYATANTIFLVTAAGLSIAAIHAAGSRRTAVAILTCIAIGNAMYLAHTYYPVMIRLDPIQATNYRMAQLAKQITPPAKGLLVFGNHWSSLIPYYSGRRSLVVVHGTPLALLDALSAAPQQFFGTVPIGAVIVCGDLLNYPPEYRKVAAHLSAGHAPIAEAAHDDAVNFKCRLYPPPRELY